MPTLALHSTEFNSLRDNLNAIGYQTIPSVQLETLIRFFDSIQGYDPQVRPQDNSGLIVVSNDFREEARVDYTNKYYINSKRPVIGNADASVDLMADGTLNKVEATVDDKTLETVIGALPVSEVVSALLIPVPETSSESFAGTTDEGLVFRVQLAIKSRGIHHVYSSISNVDTIGCHPEPDPNTVIGNNEYA
ncbi:MAG: hypothetical protein OEV49_15340 [candidate division Zixibacteria bacterium]|nr:hypothetical protein [candidate division Zixibacteria bacterium]MDH3936467.1 hypothetical protein [candidate division Zixibacteria bacterium]MDH4034827.1 hypothetical protein [candidate division Zixibacteria bacterium]